MREIEIVQNPLIEKKTYTPLYKSKMFTNLTFGSEKAVKAFISRHAKRHKQDKSDYSFIGFIGGKVFD